MANRIDFGVGFNVDASGLNQAKRAIQELKQMTTGQFWDLNPHLNLNEAKAELTKVKSSLREIEGAYERAFNHEIGTVNVRQFNAELQKSDRSLDEIYTDMAKLGPEGTAAFRSMAAGALSANTQLKETSTLLTRAGESLLKTGKWFVSSSVINSFANSINESVGYVKSLDNSLNDIRIVTNASAEEMDRFAEKAQKAAKSLGATTTDYTKAALIYRQQGLGEEETDVRTQTTLKVSNVTGQQASAVSEELTALWNGYQIAAEDTEAAVDKLSAVAAMSASSLEELATGMSKVAASASTMGVTEDQLVATMSTIISVTRQAPETVGTALKTIYARMGDLKFGKTDEDGVVLGEVSGTLAKLGIQVMDANGNMREMGTIVEETAAKWQTLTKAEQEAAAVALAGKRQYNNLFALFDNWDKYTNALDASTNSLGTLQNQQDIYMESTAGHLDKMKASFEGVYDSLLDADAIKGYADLMSGLATGAESFIDSIGGGIGTLQLLYSIVTKVFGGQIANELVNISNNVFGLSDKLGIASENAQTFADKMNLVNELKAANIDDSLIKNLTSMYDEVAAKRVKLNAEEEKELNIITKLTAAAYEKEQTVKEEIKDKEDYVKELKDEQKLLQERVKLLTGRNIDFKKYEGQTATEKGHNTASIDAREILREANSNTAFNYQKLTDELNLNQKPRFSKNSNIGVSDEAIQKAEELKQKLIEINKIRESAGKDSKVDILDNIDFSKLKDFDSFKTLLGTLKEIGNEFKNDAISISEFKTQMLEVQDASKQVEVVLNNEKTTGTELGNAFESLANATRTWIDTNKDNEAVKEELTSLEGVLNDLEGKYKELGDLNNLKPDQLEALKLIMEELMGATNDTTQGFLTLKELLDNFNNSNNIKSTEEEIKNLEQELKNAQKDVERLKERFNGFTKGLDLKSFTQGLVGLTQGLSSIAMSLTSLQSIWDTWNDDSLSTMEKTLRITTSLGMALPMLVSGLTNAGSSLKKMATSVQVFDGALRKAEQKELTTTIALTKAKDGLEKEKKQVAGASELEAGASRTVTRAEGAETVATTGKSGKGLLGKLKGLGKGGAATAAAGEMAEGGAAATSFGASLGSLALSAAAVVAVLAVVAVAVYAVVKAVNKYKDAAKDANKEAELQKKRYEEVKSAYDNLKSSIENYQGAKKGLDELTRGTREWKEAVLELNQQVLDLLDKYPELAQYVHSVNGHLEIDDEGLEELQDQQLKIVQNQQNAKTIAENNAKIAENNNMINEFRDNSALGFVGNEGISNILDIIKRNGTDILAQDRTDDLIKELSKNGFADYDSTYMTLLVDTIHDEIGALNSLQSAIVANEEAIYANSQILTENTINDTRFKEDYNQMSDTQKDFFNRELVNRLNSNEHQESVKQLSDWYEKNDKENTMRQYAEAKGYRYDEASKKITSKEQDENGKYKEIEDGDIEDAAKWRAEEVELKVIIQDEYQDLKEKAKEDAAEQNKLDAQQANLQRTQLAETVGANSESMNLDRRAKQEIIDSLSEEDLKILLDVEIPEEAKDWTAEELLEFIDEQKKNKIELEINKEEFDKDCADVEKALTDMDKPYQNFLKNNKVAAKDMKDLRRIFKDMNKDTFNKYADIMMDASSSTEDIKKAFDGLADAWIDQTGLMDNLSEETADFTQNMLEEHGVVNSVAVVTAGLCDQYDMATGALYNYKAAVIDSGNASYSAADAEKILAEAKQVNSSTSQQDVERIFNAVAAMEKEAAAAGQDTSAYQALMMQIMAAAATNYNTDLSALISEINTVNTAKNAWINYQNAKKNASNGKSTYGQGAGQRSTAADQAAEQAARQNQIIAETNAKTEDAIYDGASTPTTSGGGGGGSKGKEGKNLDKFKDEIDIYHKLNTQIALLTSQIEKLNKEKDKLVGEAYRKKVQEIIDKNKELIIQEKGKLDLQQKEKKAIEQEINTRLKLNKKEKAAFWNDDGTIAGYDKYLAKLQQDIEKKRKKYNKDYGSGKTLDDKQQKAASSLEKKIKDMEKKYKEVKDLFDKNDTLANTILEQEAEIREKYDELIETKIDAFNEAGKLHIDVSEAKKELNDFINEMNDELNSRFTFKQRVDKGYFKVSAETNKENFSTARDDYKYWDDRYKKAKADYDAIRAKESKEGKIFGDDAAKAFAAMEEAQKNRLKATQDSIEAYQVLKDMFAQYVQDIQDGYSKINGELEYYNNGLETQLNLIKLLKGENDYKDIENILEVQKQSDLTMIKLKKSEADRAWTVATDMAKKFGEGSEQYKEAYEYAMGASEELNSSITTAAERVVELFDTQLNRLSEALVQSFFGEDSRDVFNEEWKNYTFKKSTFFDDAMASSKMFGFTDLYNEYAEGMSENNKKALAAVYEAEYARLDAMREEHELSKEELELSKKKLLMTLKEIALKEAQDNKTKMRLKRDSQGNYRYVYTEDDEKKKNAEKEYRESVESFLEYAQNQLDANLNKANNYINNTLAQEYKDIKGNEKYYTEDGGWTDEGKAVYKEWKKGAVARIGYFGRENDRFIDDGVLEGIKREAILNGTMREEDFAKMTKEQFKEWANSNSSIYLKNPLSKYLNGDDKAIEKLFDDIDKKTDEALKKRSDGLTAIEQASGEKLTEVNKKLEDTSTAIGNVNTELNTFNETCNKAATAMEGVWKAAKDMIDYINQGVKKDIEAAKNGNNDITEGNKAQIDANNAVANTSTEGLRPNEKITTTDKVSNINGQLDVDDFPTIAAGGVTYTKASTKGKKKKTYKKEKAGYKIVEVNKKGTWAKLATKDGTTNIGWIQKKHLKKGTFDTGGYTGDWGTSEGRLALLHSKELVLNKYDTENILKAVESMRSIYSSINRASIERMNDILRMKTKDYYNTINNAKDNGTIEQNVHIEAHFEGQTEAHQIEMALSNLVNVASQHAWQK